MIGKIRWISVILILAGIVGFLTVADDLRHKGELIGVGSILAAGLSGFATWFIFKRKTDRAPVRERFNKVGYIFINMLDCFCQSRAGLPRSK